MADHRARQDRQPRRERARVVRQRRQHGAPGGGEHRAPARRRQLDPDAEERDPRLEHDVRRDRERRPDRERGHHVREQVRPHDPGVAGADHLRRLDELARSQREDQRAHDAGRVEPGEEADQQDQRDHALVERASERDSVELPRDGAAEDDREQQDGEGHHELGEARDDGVDPAAEEGGERAESGADQEREQRRADRDGERDAAAVEQPLELVAPQRAVGAEHEQRLARAWGRRRLRERLLVYPRHERGVGDPRPRPGRLQRDVDGVGEEIVRAVADDPAEQRRAREDGEDEDGEEPGRDERGTVAPKPPPGEPRRALRVTLSRRSWRWRCSRSPLVDRPPEPLE